MVSLGVRNRFADGGNLLHGAVRLIDCDIGIGMAIRIRIGHGNATKRLAANHAGTLRLGSIERLEQGVIFIGIAVRPAIYRDGLDVPGGVEATCLKIRPS